MKEFTKWAKNEQPEMYSVSLLSPIILLKAYVVFLVRFVSTLNMVISSSQMYQKTCWTPNRL